ncbi:TraR/DksA C4-type zinc finger protein [Patescibacteria group bacterium]|nr:TraR/DksA C4-type zinc finger protein [Patescibacteria group bacterium]
MSNYSEEFIQSQKEALLKEQIRLEQELKNVAVYDANTGQYRPKFEEFNKGDVEDIEEAGDEATTFGENTAVSDELVRSLTEVKSALVDIESDQYGFCENCNEYIPGDRLQAYPAAKTCINCK